MVEVVMEGVVTVAAARAVVAMAVAVRAGVDSVMGVDWVVVGSGAVEMEAVEMEEEMEAVGAVGMEAAATGIEMAVGMEVGAMAVEATAVEVRAA